MAKLDNSRLSMKRIGVDKANARVVAITAGAAFLVIFLLVGSFSLLGQLRYQNRIISAKKVAVKQLQANLTARDSLVASYKAFAGQDRNFIGGSSAGNSAQDGTNPKLVLDALPGTYDFPALASSLEKIATDQQLSIDGITGSDDEVAQSTQKVATPKPVEIPFTIKAFGAYDGIQKFVVAMNRSIRPVQLQKMELTGDPDKITVELTAKTFYQPQKNLTILTKDIK